MKNKIVLFFILASERHIFFLPLHFFPSQNEEHVSKNTSENHNFSPRRSPRSRKRSSHKDMLRQDSSAGRTHARTKRNDFPVGVRKRIHPPQPPIVNAHWAWWGVNTDGIRSSTQHSLCVSAMVQAAAPQTDTTHHLQHTAAQAFLTCFGWFSFTFSSLHRAAPPHRLIGSLVSDLLVPPRLELVCKAVKWTLPIWVLYAWASPCSPVQSVLVQRGTSATEEDDAVAVKTRGSWRDVKAAEWIQTEHFWKVSEACLIISWTFPKKQTKNKQQKVDVVCAFGCLFACSFLMCFLNTCYWQRAWIAGRLPTS